MIGPGAMALTRIDRGKLERERFGQRDRAGLGDVIRKIAGITRTSAGSHPVGKIDDAAAAAAAHVRNRRARAEKRGAQIDVHRRVPDVFVGLRRTGTAV